MSDLFNNKLHHKLLEPTYKGLDLKQLIIDELKERREESYINFDEQLKLVFDEFNFESVHKVYKLLNLPWYSYQTGEYYIPSIDDLKETAKKLLIEAWNSDELTWVGRYTTSTGRLVASRSIFDGIKMLELEFTPFYSFSLYDEVVVRFNK